MDKTSAQRIVRETFKASFDRKRFRDFINELCNGFDESKAISSMGVPDAFSDHIKSCQRLGTFESADGELADVLIVNLTESFKLERTRTALRDFVAHKLKRDESYKEAGLVAFVAPDSKSWRFSYVRMEYETKRDPKTGKIKSEERLTPARRHSYLVGADEECHTAQTRFLPLLQNTSDRPTLALIEDAFSVESVSKEFFAEYARLFVTTEAALAALVDKDKTLRADFEAKHVNTADFTKKLLGQIVFLYFIQKKGWLGVDKGGKWGDGPRHFLRMLANQAIEKKQNLFNDVLEPLFYDTLATDRGHEAWCETFQCRIPFLNGGLFEPLAGYDWEHTEITLPNTLLTNREINKAGDIIGTGILDVFDRYNFTVMEDEPLEKEVAIDPEMLGKVFENLLEENRRKGLGTFYTPREIVHYMCQESLINYLDTALNNDKGIVPRNEIETLVQLGERIAHYESVAVRYAIKMPKSIEQHARVIDEKLADITVCDPAIGSGAFPVGMMNEIVRARAALTPYFNDIAERSAYYFKRHAIQNSIYGVDIDAGAIEIAKLRLWLSLVVDEEDVQQIKPLPNLDYKIVVGNSLLGVEKNLFNQGLFKQLEELKPKFFNESNRNKKAQFKKQIDDLIHDLTNGREVFDYEIYFSEVFHSKQGFDIVIANPPYLGEKGNKDTFRLIATGPLGARFYKRKMDLIYFFFHLALDIAKKNGSMCFITTSYWITADGAIKLRTDLRERATILQLLNFGELRLFATAQGQHNMITLFTKNSDGDVARTLITKQSGEAKPELINSILAGNDPESVNFQMDQQQLYDGADHQIRLMPTTDRISGVGAEVLNLATIDSLSRPLVDYAESIFRGVETGCDVVRAELIEAAIKKKLISPSEADRWKVGMGIYVLSAEELDALSLNASEVRDCIKPFYKNSDIMRYYSPENKSRFLLYVDSNTDINLYPNIKVHLEKFRPLLAAREQAATESRNWFWIRGAKRKSFFYRQDSIVVPYRAESSRFSTCNQDIFGAGDIYYVTLKQPYSNRALLGFLNSSLVFYHLQHRGKRKGKMIEYYKTPLEKIPVHKQLLEDINCAQSFERVVDKILAAKKLDADADTSALEQEIDELVYALYGLTPDEIALIEAAR